MNTGGVHAEPVAAPAGAREAADEFCRALYPRLLGSLALATGDRDLAEELAQDALARAWLHWRRVSKMSSPEAWTYRCAMNLSTSSWRRRAAERRALGRVAGGLDRDSAELEPADAIAVRVAIAALPPRQRQAVVLRYYAGLSEAETATAMRCSPGTVKAHVHKALANLRRSGLVDEREGELT
jgi:RNA polymerase sigma-70 factor (sigma-E family)